MRVKPGGATRRRYERAVYVEFHAHNTNAFVWVHLWGCLWGTVGGGLGVAVSALLSGTVWVFCKIVPGSVNARKVSFTLVEPLFFIFSPRYRTGNAYENLSAF